ncbi:putative movement protein [Acidomyces richmondensis tobamo-like virus 1]|nr:putative movement protein [Acidomyces richmondensis tobamo-like virus 1]
MALRFRHDPPSFKLTRYLLENVIEASSIDTTEQIFGYAVLFTRDKKKKAKSLGLRPHSFASFANSFKQWLRTHDAAQLSRAKSLLSGSSAVGPYSRNGHYDSSGNFLGEYEVGDDEFEKLSESEFGDASTTHSKPFDKDMLHPGFTDSVRPNTGGKSQRPSEHSRENSFQSVAARKNMQQMTMQQATTAMTEGAVLNKATVASTRHYKSFDLSSLSRAPLRETHVTVSRGRYSGVTREVVAGPRGGYVITGPTGCGKSTVALLPLFVRKARVMVVEPTQANAANIFHEFRNVLPNLFAAGIIDAPVPAVEFVAPTVSKPPFAPLAVTTTQKLLEFFDYFGSFPPVDYLVIDEFHLPIPSMVEVVEFVRTFTLVPKYILVSATAQGFSVQPQLPSAVTPIYGNLPMGTIPSEPVGSDLDPRRWSNRGDGTVAVVAPSIAVANKLTALYKSWHLRVYTITRETFVSDYMLAATNYVPGTVYVLEPGVEAGVTLSMSVLISMGCTTAVRYDGRVVVEDTQPLDPIAAIQRGGRGGRVRPTLYIQPRAPEAVVAKSSADYYRAQAIIKAVALGAHTQHWQDDDIVETFPKLKTLTRSLAISALSAPGDPFVAVYSRNANGDIYRECGGSGTGFAELAARELLLYHYPGGFFIAPIADFSDIDSKPYEFVRRESQLDAAWAMASSVGGLIDRYTLDDLVGMLVGKFDVYVGDLFTRLKRIFNKPEPEKFSLSGRDSEYPEMRDFLKDSPPMVKLFEYMTSNPSGVQYSRREFPGSPNRATHALNFKGTTLNFAFDSKYMNQTTLNTKLLAKDVYELLQGLLAVEMMIAGAPQKCVDLQDYCNRVSPEHYWFKVNVTDRRSGVKF